MTQVILDIPDPLFALISNRAQSKKLKFEAVTLELLEIGADCLSQNAIEQPGAEQLLDTLIRRTQTIAFDEDFTTQDLATKGEWNAVPPATRKSIGKAFSTAVREGRVPDVIFAERKTVQNKNIYLRRKASK